MDLNQISDDDIYKMSSDPLGFCIIINIINFHGNDAQGRTNSIKSVYLMNNSFRKLKFDVRIHHDLDDNQLKEMLKGYLNKEECNKHDSFVLYIHSHGMKDGFFTANNNLMEFEEIIKIFANSTCKNFINKPKLIFFDCCRTGKTNLKI